MTRLTFNRLTRRQCQAFFTSLLLGILLNGWAQAAPDVTPASSQKSLMTQAEQLFSAELAALMQGPVAPRVGELWLLQHIAATYPSRDLQDYIERNVTLLANDPFARLIDQTVKPVELPADAGSGIMRLGNYFAASIGTPTERAAAFIHDYLAHEETGYILTHQLLVLAWAEQTGQILPAGLRAQMPQLLSKIRTEHAADPVFSDLYAERAALLMLYGDASPAEATLWVQTLLDFHTKNPAWEGMSWTYAYDGESHQISNDVIHTRGLGLLMLRLYLDND